MRKTVIKKLRQVVVKPAVKTTPSKPLKTGLKKSDPDYFKKIGLISAEKRKENGAITHEQLSAWAKKSHRRRKDYSRGGRRQREE